MPVQIVKKWDSSPAVPDYDLEDLQAGIPPENCHSQADSGGMPSTGERLS